jgi:GNAT superfamily N-acetyltransferase
MPAGILRPFEDRDYARLAAIGAAIEPTHARDVDWYQRRDRARRPHERHLRLVWETAGQAVAWGEVGHMWWGFHPRKFGLWLNVDPPSQGRGIGARLYDALLATLETWEPLVLRSETRETRPRSPRFLADRGFVEIHRRWESRLLLDRARCADVPSVEGIRIATALKLRTLEYARREGFREIRTQNDTTNAAMLRINAALGFETEPAWIIFEKRFAR